MTMTFCKIKINVKHMQDNKYVKKYKFNKLLYIYTSSTQPGIGGFSSLSKVTRQLVFFISAGRVSSVQLVSLTSVQYVINRHHRYITDVFLLTCIFNLWLTCFICHWFVSYVTDLSYVSLTCVICHWFVLLCVTDNVSLTHHMCHSLIWVVSWTCILCVTNMCHTCQWTVLCH